MRIGRGIAGTAAIAIALAGISISASPAQAATTYEVQAGTALEGKAPAEWMDFLPGELYVHTDDTIHFTSNSVHTATLLPAGEEPDQWLAANAVTGTDDFYAVPASDSDEGSNMYKATAAVGVKSRFDCGSTGQPSCRFSGSGLSAGWRGDGVLNSGAPIAAPLDFSVTITASAGATIYALCLFHPARMRLPISVVAASEPATDPAIADAIVTETLADATADAAALHKSFVNRKVRRPAPGGGFEWDAWAGLERGPLTMLAMYPSRLNLKLGDSVRWHFNSIVAESHSVSGPLETALGVANQFPTLQCDLDTDFGPRGDIDPLPPPVFCPGWLYQLELDWPEGMFPPSGDGNFENDWETSGVRGSVTKDTDDYALAFPRPTGAAGATFICLIHPQMRITVVAS
jgi:plastocyanin